ncbi:MAG: cell division protein ZapA [Chlorobium sp.]|jgi:cell division protein ZapA|uniref:cell division protein ZapA n=1 Tax=Chlorobium sp. TaxID=1095 RepID=UPI001E1167E5|nr:cell division protein ZapA [Chlorobium sp.]MBN1279469.1 cell division protein ZapA [Chlorobiaceae bacterium]MCF8216508.1 cell division protein ZapA [Chlorobium sp.]MCF8271413.1 cell division protein ZapA [Chlorobium sp.]MCF8287785.1 cell division protein ZapA [Chlorobium sp.]MCF8291324.1 cell division protein ZapA [Chlorobium sp.]
MEKIDVNVYGDSYPLRVESRELTEKAAQDVDRVMRLFAEKAPAFEPVKLAVLSAVSFAEKKIELEAELEALQQKINRLNVFIGQNL